MLTRAGAQVSGVKSGAEGVIAVHSAPRTGAPFDLLVVDSRMPEMSGHEMVDRLRHSSGHCPPIVMMVSSDAHCAKLRETEESGVTQYTVKPIKRRDFYRAISQALAPAPAQTPPEPEPHRAPAPELHLVERPLRILLADDSADNRLLVRAFLRQTPYTLDEADNGQEAIDRFTNRRYDVVLMDIQMPVLDGYTAIRNIRSWEAARGCARTPIIALTASAFDEAVRSAREAGCDLHVSKPITKSILLDSIARVLEADEVAAAALSPEGQNGTRAG